MLLPSSLDGGHDSLGASTKRSRREAGPAKQKERRRPRWHRNKKDHGGLSLSVEMPTAAKRQTGSGRGEPGRSHGPRREIPGDSWGSFPFNGSKVLPGGRGLGTAWGDRMGPPWLGAGRSLAARWLLAGSSLAAHWSVAAAQGPSSLPLPLARECSVGEFSQFQVEPPASYREPAIRADGANGRPAFSSLCVVSSAEAPVQANCRPQPVLAVGVTCREGQSPTGLDLLRAACAHAGSRFPPVGGVGRGARNGLARSRPLGKTRDGTTRESSVLLAAYP